MADARTITWVERLVWTLIYGGLFSAVIGLASLNRDPAAAWALMGAGAALALVGVILIWVRSRMQAAPPSASQGKKP